MGFSRRQDAPTERGGAGVVFRPGERAVLRGREDPTPEKVVPRLLVTGAGGMLGHRVCDVARVHGWEVVAADRAGLDVTDRAAVDELLGASRPAAVVNCAAWTDVDGAEADEAAAAAVNAEGAGNLAAAAAAVGARIVYVSTDYVFAGDAPEPYAEDAPTGPATAYGRTKLAGERAVAAANADHLVCRTAWLYGAGGANFVDTMLRLGGERDELRVVADQTGSPTWTGHLAPALVRAAGTKATGVAHLAGAGTTTWHGLASAALELAGRGTTVVPVTTAEFPRPAPRPAWSVLASTRGDVPALPDWREALAAHVREVGAARD